MKEFKQEKGMLSTATLSAQYLNNKYGANIQAYVHKYSVRKEDVTHPRYFLPIPNFIKTNDYNTIQRYVDGIKKQVPPTEDHRGALLLSGGSGTDEHAVFMVYIRENGKEGILLSDSLGTKNELANEIQQATGVEVFYTEDKRQADDSSCYVDALTFGRDTTGKDPETGNYLIPNLLTVLTERSSKAEDDLIGNSTHLVKLPNQLLKTSQISAFVTNHLDETQKSLKIHNDESLTEFRERYTKEVTNAKGEKKKQSSYLATKRKKYAVIAEIQHYSNEIKKSHVKLSDAEKKLFVSEAKEFRHASNLDSKIDALEHELGTSFSEDIKVKLAQVYKDVLEVHGLHSFSKLFLDRKNGLADQAQEIDTFQGFLANAYNLSSSDVLTVLTAEIMGRAHEEDTSQTTFSAHDVISKLANLAYQNSCRIDEEKSVNEENTLIERIALAFDVLPPISNGGLVVDSSSSKKGEPWFPSREQTAVLNMLKDGDSGLELIELMLKERPQIFSAALCAELIHNRLGLNEESKLKDSLPDGDYDARCANLILDNEAVIKQLAARKELYIFAQKDRYFVKRLLKDYSHHLNEDERGALKKLDRKKTVKSAFKTEISNLSASKSKASTMNNRMNAQSQEEKIKQLKTKIRDVQDQVKNSYEDNTNSSTSP